MSDAAPIVVGTDGSDTAERAVARAGELARALGATVHVVSSHRAPHSLGMAASGGIVLPDTSADEQLRNRAEQAVARARESLEQHGVSCRSHVCQGDAADALTMIANVEGAQMIVVGNRGMSGARRMLGSVPNRVSHTARCSVLIVPTSEHP
jgi:nucleotide-binding universal stress UspA family protein